MLADWLTRLDVGEMDLDERDAGGLESIAQSDAGVGLGRGIDEDEIRGIPIGLVDAVDQFMLGVALDEIQSMTTRLRNPPELIRNVLQGLPTIDLRLANPQHIEVRAVQDQDARHGETSG